MIALLLGVERGRVVLEILHEGAGLRPLEQDFGFPLVELAAAGHHDPLLGGARPGGRRGVACGYSSASAGAAMPGRSGQGAATAWKGASCGGPAANSQTGGPACGQGQQRRTDGAEAAARHDVDLLARLAGPVGQDGLPGAPVRRPSAGRAPAKPRQVPGNAGAFRVVRVVGGDHVQARRQRLASRPAMAEAADEERAAPVRKHQVEAAPGAGVQARRWRRRPRSAERCASASSGSSPRLRLPAAGPRLPGRFSTAATTPSPFTPIQVPPPERSRPAMTPRLIGPVRGGRVPGAVQHLVAIGGEDQRPGMAGRISRTTVRIVTGLFPGEIAAKREPRRALLDTGRRVGSSVGFARTISTYTLKSSAGIRQAARVSEPKGKPCNTRGPR